MSDLFLTFIGRAVVYVLGIGAATVAATWAAVKWLPQEWLKHRFDRQLEEQRNEHAQQLEQQRNEYAQQLEEARHRLSVLQKRLSTLHDREFEVLADVWQKLNEALGQVARLVASLQQYPAFDRMSRERFEFFVEKSQLDEVDKKDLLQQDERDRSKFYQGRIFWYRLRDAKAACTELHRAIEGNSIFLDPEILKLFREIDAAAWKTLVSREIGEEVEDRRMWSEAATSVEKEIAPFKSEIEKRVQQKLGYTVTQPPEDHPAL